MATQQEVHKYLLDYVASIGGLFSEWYAGVTDNIDERFAAHKVDKDDDRWAWKKAASEDDARDVEKALLAKGFRGDVGGGPKPNIVYVFKMTATTEPSGMALQRAR